MTSVRPDGMVEFRFFRPEARSVAVAGDFNNWDRAGAPMSRDRDGWWTAVVELRAGEYRFRYVADDDWYTDFASHGVEYDAKGRCNSVLVVDSSELWRRSIGEDRRREAAIARENVHAEAELLAA